MTSTLLASTKTILFGGTLYMDALCAAFRSFVRSRSTQTTRETDVAGSRANAMAFPPQPQKASRITLPDRRDLPPLLFRLFVLLLPSPLPRRPFPLPSPSSAPWNRLATWSATTSGVTEYHPSASSCIPSSNLLKRRLRWAQYLSWQTDGSCGLGCAAPALIWSCRAWQRHFPPDVPALLRGLGAIVFWTTVLRGVRKTRSVLPSSPPRCRWPDALGGWCWWASAAIDSFILKSSKNESSMTASPPSAHACWAGAAGGCGGAGARLVKNSGRPAPSSTGGTNRFLPTGGCQYFLSRYVPSAVSMPWFRAKMWSISRRSATVSSVADGPASTGGGAGRRGAGGGHEAGPEKRHAKAGLMPSGSASPPPPPPSTAPQTRLPPEKSELTSNAAAAVTVPPSAGAPSSPSSTTVWQNTHGSLRHSHPLSTPRHRIGTRPGGPPDPPPASPQMSPAPGPDATNSSRRSTRWQRRVTSLGTLRPPPPLPPFPRRWSPLPPP
mmetsp:Transcript_19799/g.44723  ORF Transcript_19799/g.44723 Transcript_19799/m.44723 type:complete len:495 (+) Transcript_19799:672-2156(+)